MYRNTALESDSTAKERRASITGMRHPRIYKFLVWAGPAVVVSVVGCLGLIAALAEPFPRIRSWGDKAFDTWWPVVTGTWPLIIGVLVICAYIAALIFTGSEGLQKMRRISLDDARQIAFERRVLLPGDPAGAFEMLVQRALQDGILSLWGKPEGGMKLINLVGEKNVYLDPVQVNNWLGPARPAVAAAISVFGSPNGNISENIVIGYDRAIAVEASPGTEIKRNVVCGRTRATEGDNDEGV